MKEKLHHFLGGLVMLAVAFPVLVFLVNRLPASIKSYYQVQ